MSFLLIILALQMKTATGGSAPSYGHNGAECAECLGRKNYFFMSDPSFPCLFLWEA